MVFFTYLQVMANLQLPDYMATIINKGIVLQDETLIRDTGLQMLLVTLGGAVCTVIAGYLAAHIGTGFARDVRAKVFTKVEDFSLTEFNKFSTASLITRSTNDIQQVQMVLVMAFRMVLSAPITAVGAVFKAVNLAPSMSWIMALAVACLVTVITILISIALPKFTLLQNLVDKLNLVARQTLTGLRVIRAFNTQKVEEKKFASVNDELTKTNLFVNRLMSLMQPMMMLIFNITAIGIIWVGTHLVSTNNLQVGDMLAFMQYSMQVITAFLMISIMFIMIPRAAVSGKRIEEVLESDSSIKDPANPIKADPKIKGRIEFKEVNFAYPGSDLSVLRNISFVAEPGKTTAIIGSTGSGKSTIINLIPRFYDVTSGQVLIDGVDVRDMLQSELREKLGYVQQKGVLFSGTVKSNISYGKPEITDAAIQMAAQTAQATEFIEKLSDKFDAPISQGGTNVSGGQKQRLSIARALVRKPEIYIFDDSFSALDFKTDAALRKALADQKDDTTVLIVAQRIGTILHADKIIVLDEGQIVGEGTHSQLLKTCEVYKEIAESQLSENELANS